MDRSSDTTQQPSIARMLRDQANERPSDSAILAPGRAPLSYADLWRQVTRTVGALRRLGIGSDDRVSLVLPDGPELAVALLSVCAGASAAPINPKLGSTELAVCFAGLGVRAVIVPANTDSPARDVARARGIPVAELVPDHDAPAGVFSLAGLDGAPADGDQLVALDRPDRTALVLQTSGTTDCPKTFAITQAWLWQIRLEQTSLTSTDRGLNLLPLFHLAGIGTALLSLQTGGSVICTSGLALPDFFDWLESLRPTWYIGTPTIHAAIAASARGLPRPPRSSLRLIRSISAPLSVELWSELERAFEAPVFETYGTTETGVIAITPRPPLRPKPGSVGIALASVVAILSEAGERLPAGAVGEIAVVARRALHPEGVEPDLNAFVGDWFRTGDLGCIDDEGYLFITGRIKELINRGGEKVSPGEVEAALLRHPDVSEAVAFAVPHPRLGENVAAAVVLREGASTTSRALGKFAARHLAYHKVPQQILVLPEIPRGPTGKYQRTSLARTLGLTEDAGRALARGEVIAPRDALESRLVAIWERLLNVRPIGVTDDFFALGGDSLLAVQLLAEFEREFGTRYPDALLYRASTVEQLAALMREYDASVRRERVSIVPLKRGGSMPPLFICLHVGKIGATAYRHLARQLDDEQPLIGVQSRGLDYRGIPQRRLTGIAADYVAAITAEQPVGPYYLAGHSAAGVIAYEVAQQLIARGQAVAFLGLIDSLCPPPPKTWRERLRGIVAPARKGPRPSAGARLVTLARSLVTRFEPHARALAAQLFGWAAPSLRRRSRREPIWITVAAAAACANYRPRPYRGRLTLFRATESIAKSGPNDSPNSPFGWHRYAGDGIDEFRVTGHHSSILKGGGPGSLASALESSLRAARESHSTAAVADGPALARSS